MNALRDSIARKGFSLHDPMPVRSRVWSRRFLALAVAVCVAAGWRADAAQAGKAASQGGEAQINWALLLPDEQDNGPGKNAVLTYCASCHSLENVVLGRRSNDEWFGTTGRMMDEFSAWIPAEEMDLVAEYLGRVAGEDNPLEKIPMDLNEAPGEALARLSFLSAGQIEDLVESRKSKPFESMEAVEALLKMEPEAAAQLRRITEIRGPK